MSSTGLTDAEVRRLQEELRENKRHSPTVDPDSEERDDPSSEYQPISLSADDVSFQLEPDSGRDRELRSELEAELHAAVNGTEPGAERETEPVTPGVDGGKTRQQAPEESGIPERRLQAD